MKLNYQWYLSVQFQFLIMQFRDLLDCT